MTDQPDNERQSMGNLDSQSDDPIMLGDHRLHQVREFLEDSNDAPVNPISFLTRSLRGRVPRVMMLCLLLSAIFAVAGYHAISPKFQSQGLIRVAARIPKIMYADPNDPRLRLFDSFVSAEVTYLKSRPVLERTLRALSVSGEDTTDNQIDIADLGQMVAVRKDKGLITVSAVASTPENASAVVNTLLQSYTELHAESLNQSQTIREKQLVQRENDLFVKLQNIKENILEVGKEHGTTSIAKAHLHKVTQLEDVDQRLSELETTIAQVEAKDSTTEFDTGDDEIKRVTVLDKAMADMTYDRAKRSARLAAFKLRYNPNHSKVVELEREIQVIEGAIESRRQQIVTLGKTGALTGGSEQKEEDSLAGLLALREKLADRRIQVAVEAKALNNKLIQLTFLKEEYSEIRSLLDETRRALEEVRVESSTNLPGSVEVISTGATPSRPMEDKRKKIAVAGAGFGFLSGFGLFLIGTLARPTLRFSDDLTQTVSEPLVLGALPEFQQVDQNYRHSVHRIRNRLQLADGMFGPGSRSIVLTICSSSKGSGATTFSRELATSFNMSGLRTTLVDANLNAPILTNEMGITEVPGLRDAISARDFEIKNHVHDFKDFSIFPAGQDLTIGDEHLSLPRVRAIMNELRKISDIVIVDAGPYEDNLSANLMTSLADQVVVLARSGVNTSIVRRIMKWLEGGAKRSPLFVINHVSPNDPGLVLPKTIDAPQKLLEEAA